MLYIVPSRGRPHNVRDLIDAWADTRTEARLQIVVDEDDPELPGYKEIFRERSGNWFSLAIAPPLGGLGPILNMYAGAAVIAGDEHDDIIGFMGDDHRPRTGGWDYGLSRAARGGIAYGNDLFQGPNLPTAVAMDSRIIAATGYMVPPDMTHLYVDNVWKEWGKALGALRYLPHVEIEHVHPAAGGKAPDDERYAFVNSEDMWRRDGAAYQRYMATKFWDDVHKMKNAFGEGPWR